MFTVGDLEAVLNRTTLAADDQPTYDQAPDIVTAAVEAGAIDRDIAMYAVGEGSYYLITLAVPGGLTLASAEISARAFDPPRPSPVAAPAYDGILFVLKQVMTEVGKLKKQLRELTSGTCTCCADNQCECEGRKVTTS